MHIEGNRVPSFSEYHENNTPFSLRDIFVITGFFTIKAAWAKERGLEMQPLQWDVCDSVIPYFETVCTLSCQTKKANVNIFWVHRPEWNRESDAKK